MFLDVEDLSGFSGDVALEVYGAVSLGITSVIDLRVSGLVTLWITNNVINGIPVSFSSVFPGLFSLGSNIYDPIYLDLNGRFSQYSALTLTKLFSLKQIP